jgi:Tfp pilus assembly protein PilV
MKGVERIERGALSVKQGSAPGDGSQPSAGFARPPSRCRAFSLLEVMIACGIFFMATFAILGLVAGSLRNARALQKTDVDISIAAAQIFQALKTNTDANVSFSGDFGNVYPDYSWAADVSEYMTNGLLQVDVVLARRGRGAVDTLTFYVFSPNAKSSTYGPRTRP